MSVKEALAAAEANAQRRDWRGAAECLDGLPDTNDVLDKRGWYLSRDKQYDKAIAVFETLQLRRPRDYLPPYMIGFQLYQQQQWAESLPHFAVALGLNPQHLKSLWRRAHALDQLGQTTQAMLAAGRILRIWRALPPEKQEQDEKRYAQACHLLAKHQMRRDPSGAAELLRNAVEHDPGDPYNHQQLAKALLATDEPTDALAAAAEARRLKPRDTVIDLTYCSALHATGDTEAARELLGRTERHCRGWNLIPAARLALEVADPHLAVNLCDRARRDRAARDVSTLDVLSQRAAEAAADVPKPERAESRRAPSSSTCVGHVDVVREDRGFGFLVDDGGTRRHFRIRGAAPRKGERVRFTPAEGEKGPSARDVRTID
jgi:tetratricopeptide (TPR) repeat protein/cold shock CspA family protein